MLPRRLRTVGTMHSAASKKVMLAGLILVSTLFLAGTMVSAEEGIIQGRVRDIQTMEPIANATVVLSERDSGTFLASTLSDDEGRYVFTGLYYGWLTVTASVEGYNETSKDFYVKETFDPPDAVVDITMSAVSGPDVPTPTTEPTPPLLLYGAVIAILAIASAVMYSKIKRDNLLKHAVRRRIHEYVRENPGAHYRAILDDLELSMGVLTYHLNRLEKGEYLRSRQDGMYRRFFVTGRKTEVRFFLSDIQESILATIRAHQGISQSRIAESIGVTRKVVNYHVKILDQAGLIYMEDRGRETACFARECGPSAAV
jgi:DNA-binding MarR family transcriptional regulator